MPRKSREEMAGGVYHVFSRGVRKEPIFGDDDDRREYLAGFGLVALELGWKSLAFCLMSNHVHHVIELTEPNLSAGVRIAHRDYAREFNTRYSTGGGHLFQERFGSTRAKSEGAVMYFACYVVLNPIRAGMCQRPEEYAWSSYGATVGSRAGPRWLQSGRLLEHFAREPAERVARFSQIVETVRLMGAAGFEPATSRV